MKGLHQPQLYVGLALAVLGLGAPAGAQTESQAVEASAKALAKEYKALDKEFKKARSDVFAEMRKLPEGEQMAYYEAHAPNPEDYVPRFFDLAERAARTDTAAQCYRWVISNSQDEENFLICTDVLMRDHVDSDVMAEVCSSLQYHDRGGDALMDVIAESRNESVVGHAHYYMGKKLADSADWGGGAPDARERAAEHLQKVVADYAEHAFGNDETLGSVAGRVLFAVQNLVIGKEAPDIEGKDIDGVSFKLSDYRGKVILLDFWGHW